MKILTLLSLLVVVTSCSSPTSQPTSQPTTAVANAAIDKADTINFPIQQATILHDEDAVNLRLPYIRLISTDSSKRYLVLCTYKGEQIGFEFQIPLKGLGVAQLISIGQPSDNFLRFLQTAYSQKVDKASHFADTVKADCLSMGDYVDSLRKNTQSNYVTLMQNKLFFEPNDPDWEAECYLNINPADHWIELDEKEPEYRKGLIRDIGRSKISPAPSH